MNGQLSEQPLAELIREISAKSLGGRLSLEHDRIKVVSYFENGTIVYAASNLRALLYILAQSQGAHVRRSVKEVAVVEISDDFDAVVLETQTAAERLG